MSHQPRPRQASSTWSHFGQGPSLRWRLLTLLGGMLLVTLLAIGTGVLFFIAQNEQHTWQARQHEAAHHAAAITAAFIQRVKDSLVLIDLLEQDELASAPHFMTKLLAQNTALLELVYLDATGSPLASAYQDTPVLSNLFTAPQSIWFRRAAAGEVYLGDVQISAESEPYLIIAMPAHEGGVIAARLDMRLLWDKVAQFQFGQMGQAYVINQNGLIIAHTQPEVPLAYQTLTGRPELEALAQAQFKEWSGKYSNFQGIPVVGVTAPVAGTDWVIITELPQNEASAISQTALLIFGGGLALFGLLVILLTGRFLDRLILQPMETLRAGAVRIGQGDLQQRIEITQYDEVGQVAYAFNDMVERLRSREAALRTAADISKQINSILNPDQLLTEVVSLFKDRFNLHGVQVYLLDETSGILRLEAGSYPAETAADSQHVQIPLDQEDCRVARRRAREIISGNGQPTEADLLPVKTELAIPLLIQDKVLGVLNIFGDTPRLFTASDLDTFDTLAGQIATALENARLFAENLDTTEHLFEVDRLKNEFLANMSHELRTPLNSITGYAEILLMGYSGQIDEEARSDVEAIYSNSQHLVRLVNDILDLAKIEAGRFKLNLEELSIKGVLQQIKTSAVGLLNNKPIQFTIDAEADLPPLQADRVRVNQILTNLISNAVKFTDAGRISLRAFRENGWVCFAVEDTGIGISQADMQTIFEKFRQADGSLTRRAEGTGLGLTITRHLVELHGGNIEVNSQLGQGSTFTIRLPVAKI
ncbi:MAG: GAF domain-containing protein [Anaerolineales bacterium]|nr:GAF domain-containing protein [Anaerolineales bacterium]